MKRDKSREYTALDDGVTRLVGIDKVEKVEAEFMRGIGFLHSDQLNTVREFLV
jgi:hypothetical protein